MIPRQVYIDLKDIRFRLAAVMLSEKLQSEGLNRVLHSMSKLIDDMKEENSRYILEDEAEY